MLLLTGAPALRADASPDRERAESELRAVLQKIGEVTDKLAAARKEHRSEQSRLRTLELEIQDANLRYRALDTERRQYASELQKLEMQRGQYLEGLGRRLEQLSDQVATSYRLSKQSRLKLILNQDDPAQLGRLLAYYEYLNRAQLLKITELRNALTTLEDMQQSIDRELTRVARVQKKQQEVLDMLQGQREERSKLLGTLSAAIQNDESRLRELDQNRADLEALIERLADVLADIPADLGERVDVQGQKGRLPLPLAGPVRQAFGQTRAGGMNWQGWLIGAEPGSEVRAVAYGRVAFADWLRGYGLIIIIDHGNGFMSLYGHNETLLQEAGDWVEPGETISIVGANPAIGQGLYFELRKEGKALDPAAWIAR